MSGHSKWSTIKHKKAANDAKRGKLFTRLNKEITIAAKLGGGDPDSNPRLRTAVAQARGANMPTDNIKRAIQKGTGELPGVEYEEINYEGYAPGGVAVFVECLTDNRNRTTPEMRHVFSKHGGSLAEPNSVAWMFDRIGRFLVPANGHSEESLMDVVVEAGAEDIQQLDDAFQVLSPPDAFHAVQQALEGAGIATSEAALSREPQNTVQLSAEAATDCIKLLEKLEDHDDVQNVYANLDVED